MWGRESRIKNGRYLDPTIVSENRRSLAFGHVLYFTTLRIGVEKVSTLMTNILHSLLGVQGLGCLKYGGYIA